MSSLFASSRSVAPIIVVAFCALAVAACEREERQFRPKPPEAALTGMIQMSPIQPGMARLAVQTKNSYEDNAYAVAQGQQLFRAYNCNGCHSNGGGGMGPPLMDGKWIYGSDPANIVATILEGRPNGMPSFSGKIPEQQVWECGLCPLHERLAVKGCCAGSPRPHGGQEPRKRDRAPASETDRDPAERTWYRLMSAH
jgi:cytochrome c oxidase cbb3-type subunit III